VTRKLIYIAWVFVALYVVTELVTVDGYMKADGRRLTARTVVEDVRLVFHR
jgi:hypothetical protein